MFRTTTFIPTMRVQHKREDGFSETGKPQFVSSGKIGISPVRLEMSITSTSIRTDKSGSKSRAEEETKQGRVLVDPKADIAQGDLLTVYNKDWRIVGIYPRHDMDGRISHFQVDLTAWV